MLLSYLIDHKEIAILCRQVADKTFYVGEDYKKEFETGATKEKTVFEGSTEKVVKQLSEVDGKAVILFEGRSATPYLEGLLNA